MYFNFAPIYRGGSNHTDEHYFVHKQYISTADFLSLSEGLPDPRGSHITKYDSLGLDQELLDYFQNERDVQMVQDNIVTIDGIRIGIEICLDHRLGVLWHGLQEQQKRVGEDGDVDDDEADDGQVSEDLLVDVHLITSAGMSIERGPTPVKQGGVVYLTDGEASSAACRRPILPKGQEGYDFDPKVVCRDRHNDGPTGLRHVPNGGPGYSSFIELATCLNPDDAPWKPLLEGYYSNHATQGCAYTLKLHGIDVF